MWKDFKKPHTSAKKRNFSVVNRRKRSRFNKAFRA